MERVDHKMILAKLTLRISDIYNLKLTSSIVTKERINKLNLQLRYRHSNSRSIMKFNCDKTITLIQIRKKAEMALKNTSKRITAITLREITLW